MDFEWCKKNKTRQEINKVSHAPINLYFFWIQGQDESKYLHLHNAAFKMHRYFYQ
jgi:hypothetical protein